MKPSIPKGTRDFSPVEMAKRNYIFNTIRSVFANYGFKQIETPSMENLSTLMGKYGEEGDKLLFKVLNSGDWAAKLSDEELLAKNSIKLTNKVSEKGLRYDLTVPFARYVVQHRDEITFPFKRFQIQPVWRADRPQKGRYREFFQCDADVVGSDSLVYEAEMIEMIDQAFQKFGIDVVVKLNNRKVLAGIAEWIGEADRIIDITVAIDKMDKIGLDKVNEEMIEKGIPVEAVEKLKPVLLLEGTNDEKVATLRGVLAESATAQKGLDELEEVLRYVAESDVKCKVELDLTLARGLNYYTGAILEVKALGVEMGSISGGGRYDNLTGIFGLPGVSGVGFSFGADRIYDVLTMLDKFPKEATSGTQVIFLAFDQKGLDYSRPLVRQVRRAGIAAEIYPEVAKMKKQMTYADNNQIPYVAIVGDSEIEAGKVMLKNMASGEQQLLSVEEVITLILG
ncbi:MAG: histidine--tRNA ligase [Paludibacteraceae bacterium]|nr:histidine--tRNA ligase [Paludibacteraceae bacterium]